MNIFPKLSGKEGVKNFNIKNQCDNPPNKSLLKPKSLLIEIPEKSKKRNFGKEIQNIGLLTEQNIISFNHKKRKRNKNDIIPIAKKQDKNKEIKFCTKKINEQGNKNTINHNLIIDKNCINISESKETNENKENIQRLNNPITIIVENNNNINIKSIKPNLIKISITTNIKLNSKGNNNSIKKEAISNKLLNNNNKKDKTLSKNNIEEKNDIKIIKVNIQKDINIHDKNNSIRYNLQRAKEYLEEIHYNLKSIESKGIALSNYMSLIQTDINEKMRIILINWLIEVHFKFHLLNETLFICINIIDRYLSHKNINRKYLQLLGITSLFIASKYEEIYPPSSKDLIYMTDNAYQIDEMIKMENEILGVLKFELTYPTSLRFLELYGNILNLDENNFFRCYYLNEVSLISYNLCGICPSLIACACLYINLKSNIMFSKGYNEEELFKITGYEKAEINSCLNNLSYALIKMEEPNNKFISIKKKYALDKYMNVSNNKYMIETN